MWRQDRRRGCRAFSAWAAGALGRRGGLEASRRLGVDGKGIEVLSGMGS